MKVEFLSFLRCPKTGKHLELRDAVYEDGRVRCGYLLSADCLNTYPIRDFIPRFVPESNYADNFGMQWNQFRKTQLDSFSGQSISADRFWKATGWKPEDIANKLVLDVGCGAGRFAEIALKAGATVVALDYSSAVDACYDNLKQHPNLLVVQADIYALPFSVGAFPFVYSLGVLQHTPDVEEAVNSLPPIVARGGHLCVDFYWKRVTSMLHVKYLLRPVTKRIPEYALFRLLQRFIPNLLKVSQTLGTVPMVGKILKRVIPVADYTGIYPLNESQLLEWALLDTFDMLAPMYDSPQTVRTVRRWLGDAGIVDVEVLHAGHLVARGLKL